MTDLTSNWLVADQNISETEYITWVRWIAPQLWDAIDSHLPRGIIEIFMRYILLDQRMYFEAVIRIQPDRLECIWKANAVHKFYAECDARDHRESSGKINGMPEYMVPYDHAPPPELHPNTIKDFNYDIFRVIMGAEYHDNNHDTEWDNDDMTAIAEQFRENADVLLDSDWPICDSELRLMPSGSIENCVPKCECYMCRKD
jgi:hypothetical protein